MEKESAIAKLLQPTPEPKPGTSLICEVGAEHEGMGDSMKTNSLPVQPTAAEDEGPTMMELMMAAQQEAQQEKEQNKEREKKSNFSGFKKGFFGGKTKNQSSVSKTIPSSSSATASSTSLASSSTPVIEVKKNAHSKKDSSLVFDDVQRAMEEDQHPLLKSLKSNDWVTPDLMSSFASNPVLSSGFANPKCMAAMQMMQKDPKKAMENFKGDPDVTAFLKEFGAVMGKHFEALGEAPPQPPQPQQTKQEKSHPIISEINRREPDCDIDLSGMNMGPSPSSDSAMGPLHRQVLERERQRKKAEEEVKKKAEEKAKAAAEKKKTSDSSSAGTQNAQAEEEERAKKVLEDPELRSMLMDPELQRVLMECGDPSKYAQHMRDPVISYKIRKLFEAGLVGQAR